MKKKRLWEVLIEKGIKETSGLARAIRSIRNDKRLSLKERKREENIARLQFLNNGWHNLNRLLWNRLFQSQKKPLNNIIRKIQELGYKNL